MEKICPSCNFAYPHEYGFCGKCGHQLEESTTRKIEPPIEDERKHVTVLFSDLSGYTSMSERLDPEDVKKIMRQIFDAITSVVNKYNGSIQKFIGDAVVAFFGVPMSHEDDPVRAIRTAKEIHEIIDAISPQFEPKVGKPLALHTGINTGLVVTGELTTGEGIFGITGDTVNLASRLSTLARSGEILVGQDTYRRADWLFLFESLGPVRVKGKAEPVQVYRVGREKKQGERSLGVESPLVGREKEMDLLSLQLLNLIKGTGGVVTVTGEAGIGKSRLLAELQQNADFKKTYLLEGRALSMGRSLSFYPIIDALKHWSQIRENDTDSEAQWKLERAIRDIDPQEAEEIFPFIATLMGMKLTGRYAERVKGIEGEALEKLIFKSMRKLLMKGSEVRPAVFYLEDFHWVDTSSLELVKSLLRLVEEYRILVIIAFRTGYSDTGEEITAFIQENFPSKWTKIELEPLIESESSQMLSNLLQIKNFPGQLRAQIIQRAGGNPFFIEEVVRSLINAGAVISEKGEYRVTGKINNVVIPQSIDALINARIDQLDLDTKNLVRIASVIGRTFFYRILIEVADTIDEVDRKLDYLKEIQMIRERKRMEEVEYLFKHALTQEAVYESILIQRRKEIHQKVAQSIENVFNERLHEFYGMLAYHYIRAESLEKAEECLIKAGEEALKSSASIEALHYYKEALSIYQKLRDNSPDPEKVAMLEKNIGLALYNRGQYEEAIEHINKALKPYGGVLPRPEILRLVRFSSGFFHLIVSLYLPSLKFRKIPKQEVSESIDLYFKKCEALSVIDPKRYLFNYLSLFKKVTKFDLPKLELGPNIFVGASSLFSFSGISFRLSRKILDSTRKWISKENPKIRIEYDLVETIHNYLSGHWDKLVWCDDDLVNKSLSVGDTYSASMNLFWHGIPTIYQGRFKDTESSIKKLNRIFEDYGNDLTIMLKQLLNTSWLMESRKLYEASNEIEKGIELAQKTNNGIFLIHLLSCKAQIQLLNRNVKEARKYLKQAAEINHHIEPIPWQLSNFLKTKLEFDLCELEESIRKGNGNNISEYQKKALKSSKELLKQSRKVSQHRTESFRLMGVYFWLTKNQRKALLWWNRTIKEGERLGAQLELSRTYFEVGKRLLGPESRFKTLNGKKAEEYLELAKARFAKLGLKWDLDEWGRVAKC